MGSNATTLLSVHPDVPTVIFIAGVEGAGHHFMEKFMDHVLEEYIELPEAWGCWKTWTRDGIDTMLERMARLQKGRAYILHQGSSQASYPCGGGTHETRLN